MPTRHCTRAGHAHFSAPTPGDMPSLQPARWAQWQGARWRTLGLGMSHGGRSVLGDMSSAWPVDWACWRKAGGARTRVRGPCPVLGAGTGHCGVMSSGRGQGGACPRGGMLAGRAGGLAGAAGHVRGSGCRGRGRLSRGRGAAKSGRGSTSRTASVPRRSSGSARTGPRPVCRRPGARRISSIPAAPGTRR
jgi:hypothetical protein